jgi:hypothetical protein
LSWDTWVAVAYIIILYSCSRLKSQMLERGKASAHPRGVGRVAERGADNRLPASGGERGQRLREKRSKLLKGRKKEIKTERERIHFGVAFSINNNFKVRRDTCCDSTKKGKDMNEKRKKRNRIMNE